MVLREVQSAPAMPSGVRSGREMAHGSPVRARMHEKTHAGEPPHEGSATAVRISRSTTTRRNPTQRTGHPLEDHWGLTSESCVEHDRARTHVVKQINLGVRCQVTGGELEKCLLEAWNRRTRPVYGEVVFLEGLMVTLGFAEKTDVGVA